MIDNTHGDGVEQQSDERPTIPVGNRPGSYLGLEWANRGLKNEAKWGIQHPEELLSAINEEVGEIEQAYLEATHEDGNKKAVQDEIHDLGPLLMQLIRSVGAHPMAFEPLPTAEEARSE